MPEMSPDENRIAQAVIVAIVPEMNKRFVAHETRLDLQFAGFEERMDRRFTRHIEELESHYSANDNKRQDILEHIEGDYKTILSTQDKLASKIDSNNKDILATKAASETAHTEIRKGLRAIIERLDRLEGSE